MTLYQESPFIPPVGAYLLPWGEDRPLGLKPIYAPSIDNKAKK